MQLSYLPSEKMPRTRILQCKHAAFLLTVQDGLSADKRVKGQVKAPANGLVCEIDLADG